MNWILLDPAKPIGLSSNEAGIYRDYINDDYDEVDPLPGILDEVAAQVRLAIGSCSRNTLSRNEKAIPLSFRGHAHALARYALLNYLPHCAPGEGRTKEYETAVTFLKNVATCVIRPEPADDARPNESPQASSAASAEVLHSRPNISGRQNLSGL